MNLSTLIAAAQAHAATHRLLHAAAEALDIDVDCHWSNGVGVMGLNLHTREPGNRRAVDAVTALGATWRHSSGRQATAHVGDVVLFAGRR